MNNIEKLRIYFNMPNATEYELLDRYIDLSYNDMIKCQIKGLGRSLHLVAKDVSTQEECEMYNFLENQGDMLCVLETWQNIYTDNLEKDTADNLWHKYGDLYIYATDEEIKAFIADIKKSPHNTEGWFGKRYKLQEYN